MTEISSDTIRQKLHSLADPKYREFHSGLVPGCDTILGVRVPVLRRYAKELLKEYTAEQLLDTIADSCYEEIMLQGMVIGLQKHSSIECVLQQIREFVPKIDNWAVCDMFCSGLKITKSHRERMFEFLKPYFLSEREFDRRFGIVMLLDYYVEEAYLSQIFSILDQMNCEGYYVQMAAAWAVSECLARYYDETKAYLASCQLDDFTYNKAIQKACESYRVSPEQKAALRAERR